jgi:hypothetical protein
MPLPLQTVDRIFARLLVRYGSAWLRTWEGIDEAAVKADWANELRGASNAAILHALGNLPPDRPPTVGQFRLLCINRPVMYEHKQLERPAPSQEEKQRVREMLARARASITGGQA